MTKLDESARLYGKIRHGENVYVAQGTVIRSIDDSITIRNTSWILENSVLHLLPDNKLIIEDNVTIGPGCIVHGSNIGENSIIESGAIVCDYSKLGKNTLVKSGSLVKQRDVFEDDEIIEGFPGKSVGKNSRLQERPKWAY